MPLAGSLPGWFSSLAVLTDWQAQPFTSAFEPYCLPGVDTERRDPRVTFWRIRVKSIRRYGALEALRGCLWAAVLGAGACGGPSETVRSPAPAKVAWDKSEGQSEPETEGSSAA